jgi:hypothetical protein
MRIDRYEAPNYLAKYRERQNRKVEETPDDGTPLYLRRFRAKGAEVPVETVDGESFTRDYIASLPTNLFPNMTSLASEFALADPDERFELLLDIFVDGLARRAAAA